MRAVETGQAQAGEVLMSLLANQNPIFSLDSLPFVATGFDDAYRLWQAQRPVLDRVLTRRGVKLLYAVAWPPQGIYAKRELKSAADMKGLKWRAYNPATTKIAQAVGAQPLTIQAAELSQALATGVVDSFMSSGATGVDSKVWESLTHFHTVDAWLPKNMVVVNQKDFDKLDKPTQDTLMRLATDAEKRGWDRMRSYTTESLDILRKNRMAVVTPSPQLMSDMRKIGDEMLADWLKQAGAEGNEIIDAYRKSAPAPKK
jgi:TRAP-type C4-dicarboxylate transport system substrate-binding protein